MSAGFAFVQGCRKNMALSADVRYVNRDRPARKRPGPIAGTEYEP